MLNQFPEPHISSKEAAILMGVTAKTLRNWRSDAIYLIPYIKKSNGHTYYSMLHVTMFVKDRTQFKRTIKKLELSF